jgi:hypothetical protein
MRQDHIERVDGVSEGIDFDAHYIVGGWRGIAFRLIGWQTEPDEDTEWSGIENRTGNVVAVMVGDDRKHFVDPSDLAVLGEDKFCRDCGQIGCGCNVYA